MFARVTTLQAPLDRFDEGARMIQERVIPAARQQRGFRGGYWLGDRQTGKAMAVVLWEDEEAVRASDAAMAQSRSQAAQGIGATIQSVEVFEVIAQA